MFTLFCFGLFAQGSLITRKCSNSVRDRIGRNERFSRLTGSSFCIRDGSITFFLGQICIRFVRNLHP